MGTLDGRQLKGILINKQIKWSKLYCLSAQYSWIRISVSCGCLRDRDIWSCVRKVYKKKY